MSAELRLKISEFKAANLSKLSYDQIANRMGRIMHQYAVTLGDLWFQGPLYRARINKPNQDFRNVSDLWYRTEKVDEITMGRFNKNGEGLFYASIGQVGLSTAVFELQPKIGDIVTVMEALPKSALGKISILPIGLSRSKSPLVPDEFKQERVKRASSFSPKKWLIADNFLEQLLTEIVAEEERHKYMATAAAAEHFFKIPNLEAIQYPSIATSLNGLNVVLKPENADRLLKPSKFHMLEVLDILNDPKGGLLYKCRGIKLTNKIGNDGEIFWK